MSQENKSYEICQDCDGKCVLLNEAGFEVNTHVCAICRRDVADADDFFNPVDVEMMSK